MRDNLSEFRINRLVKKIHKQTHKNIEEPQPQKPQNELAVSKDKSLEKQQKSQTYEPAHLVKGMRKGLSFEMQKAMAEKFQANSRKERQLSEEELEKQRTRTRTRKRQRVRQRERSL